MLVSPSSRPRLPALALVLALTSLPCSTSTAQSREEKVRGDRERIEAQGFWIYNDLNRGIAEARQSGKPILAVLRCIPCEECVKLDEDLIEQDPLLRPLLEKYVRVRIVSTNGLDLSVFQYDYDQSFVVFLMNADKTVYGRFGTRSDRTLWADDVSIEGLAQAMEAALALHQNYPANKELLAGKQGREPLFPTPEQFPTLADKYKSTLDYEGNVVQSCIHCHQIGDAQREYHRNRTQPIPSRILFQYPHPKAIGLILDPLEKSTVKRVAPPSLARRAGFQAGDEILTIQGQPILSLADVQWVLHNADDGDTLDARVRRGEETVQLQLPLPEGWRQQDDLSWRVTTWPLRRMVLGGMVLRNRTLEETREAKYRGEMELVVKLVGQYGPHAAAKRAGFRVGDLVVGYDGKKNFHRETDLIAYAVNALKVGETVEVDVVRDNRLMKLRLPIQQ